MTHHYSNDTGQLQIRSLDDGCYALTGLGSRPNIRIPHSPCVTSYPLELIKMIFDAYGATHTCDEISRDTDETEATLDVLYSIKAYFGDDIFSKHLKILDYGCGAGSSTMTLARLFRNADILGQDFVGQFLAIAEARVRHYGIENARFERVLPSADSVAPGEAAYDFVFLNAVYEHLLPTERPAVISSIWRLLKPGGYLVLNQTPHRWFPIETHTSGLPLINYLPKWCAHWAIQRFSNRDIGSRSWEALLRSGVRGATVREIMRHIKRVDIEARRLNTVRLSTSWAGLWYAAKRERLGKIQSHLVRRLIVGVEAFVRFTRVPFSPYLSLVIQKSGY